MSLITKMDHEYLSYYGLAMLERDNDAAFTHLNDFVSALRDGSPGLNVNASVSPREAVLDCASCHLHDDRHWGLFGEDCVNCHEVVSWSLSAFRHPGPASTECTQCHQAPPSHYMMHFKMISAKVAGKPHAKLEQCYECHQSTSWNDIKRVGIYKHH